MVDFYYKKHGNGIKKLIFFHGFGEDRSSFDKMILGICNEKLNITCYNIDLYYHGKTTRENRPLLPEQWKRSFKSFLEAENIKSYSVIGFSLGGRFALSTASLFPESTDSVFLIAPDGIFQSPWYRLANTLLGNMFFKYLMEHPLGFDWLINVLRKTGVVSKPLHRFVETTLKTTEQRKRVYQTWTYFHPLQISPKAITTHFNRYDIPIHVILGDRDKIIPPKKILSKIKNIRKLKSTIIKAKHHHMITESMPYIISVLKNPNL